MFSLANQYHTVHVTKPLQSLTGVRKLMLSNLLGIIIARCPVANFNRTCVGVRAVGDRLGLIFQDREDLYRISLYATLTHILSISSFV